jgi:imidazolonepropionase-like amidohydrolase
MRRWLLVLAIVLLGVPALLFGVVALSVRLPAPLEPPEPGGLLEDVTLVIPGLGRAEHRNVVIMGDRIASITPALPGDGPFKGAFAFPGLIDSHVHFPDLALGDEVPLHAFLYLAHGVTTVRNLGDTSGNAPKRAQGGIEAGQFAGPRVLRCGPFIDGPGGIWGDAIVVTEPVEADAVVDRIVAEGLDCVKAYDELSPEVLGALVQAAGRAEIPLVGHVPRRVDFGAAGLDDAQHLRGVPPPRGDGSLPPPPPLWWRDFIGMNAVQVAERVGEALWQDMAVTPTLAAQSQLLVARDDEAFAARPELALLPPWYRSGLWHPTAGISAIRRVPADDREWLDPAFAKMKSIVRRMHSAGVRVHSGTDSGAPGIVPGAALHEELRLLVDAGLTPEEALEVSMVATAAAMRIPELGTLAPGAPADLVLFARDPTEDLAHLDTIVAVVSQGRIFSRETLEAQRALYQARYAEVGPDVVMPALARVGVRLLLFLATEGDVSPDSSPRP